MASESRKKAARKTGKKPSKTAKKAVAKRGAAKAARPRRSAAGGSSRSSASARIDAYIAGLGDWRGARLAEIRALIRAVDPEVVEEWKWMGSPVWSHEGMLAVANAHKQKVKLTFFHGARLLDPGKLFNNGLDGNRWRAIDLHEGDAIDRKALAALLREAIDYNCTHPVPRSRGSRA